MLTTRKVDVKLAAGHDSFAVRLHVSDIVSGERSLGKGYYLSQIRVATQASILAIRGAVCDVR